MQDQFESEEYRSIILRLHMELVQPLHGKEAGHHMNDRRVDSFQLILNLPSEISLTSDFDAGRMPLDHMIFEDKTA